jgi:hypothetical protein
MGRSEQAAVVLAGFRRLHPKCAQVTVLERHGRLYVHDPESQLYWEAVPGGATRDPSGYGRPDTISYYLVEWPKDQDPIEPVGHV